MRQFVIPIAVAVAATCVMTVAGCGGGGSTSPSPSPAPTPAPTPTPTPSGGTTVTITSSGVSPKSITITAGTRVTFINNDTRAHDMESNPHPEHTDCPEINQVGFLSTGQTKLTGNLNTRRTCGYHDHNLDTDTRLQGSIVIQ